MGENLTPGDETGARAERLARIRRRLSPSAKPPMSYLTRSEARDLLAELDRVTAERDKLFGEKLRTDWTGTMLQNQDHWAMVQERAAAIASRNAWAEKAAKLSEALAGIDLYAGTAPAVLNFTTSDPQKIYEAGWNSAVADIANGMESILAATEPKP